MDYKTWKLKHPNNKNTFDVPSVFQLGELEKIPLRKRTEILNFIEKALSGVILDKSPVTLHGPSAIRHTVLKDIDRILKDTSIHFSRFEIATVLNVFYALLDYNVRLMEKKEFRNFLHLTLGITDLTVLTGIWRAVKNISGAKNPNELKGLDGPLFVKILSILLRGSLEERAKLTFYILDENDDGTLNPEFDGTLSLKGTFDPHISASSPSLDPEEPSRDMEKYLCQKMNIPIDGGIAIDAFVEKCRESPWLIDCILPTLPSELNNYAFQTILCSEPKVPETWTREEGSQCSNGFSLDDVD